MNWIKTLENQLNYFKTNYVKFYDFIDKVLHLKAHINASSIGICERTQSAWTSYVSVYEKKLNKYIPNMEIMLSIFYLDSCPQSLS